MANIVNQIQKPTLVISHNKTLAAQLASEFTEFFPQNAVHYFVSYYDYYQPEAYIPRSDTYIEKETEINEEIDKLRNAATQSLLSRQDVLIVASVSCIYGLGSPTNYLDLSIKLTVGNEIKREKFLRRLTDLQFIRSDAVLSRGTYRVRGDIVELIPASEELVYRLEFFGDTLEKITSRDQLKGLNFGQQKDLTIFPTKHFVTPREKLINAVENIRTELSGQINLFKKQNKLLEAQRIEQRTNFDIEMMLESGYVNGIENYSRQLDFRTPGEPPSTLLDYFPDDFLLFIDESHITIPQIRGMYAGDRTRKQTLIDYGFRLPSAIDNRPLKFSEFEQRINQTIFVSATPKPDYELQISQQIVQQLIRPTGLLDPDIEIRKTNNQIQDLIKEIEIRIKNQQRILVTTLTKNMAEELANHLTEFGIKVHYLHSEIDTLERLEILRDLRLGTYDVLVGINLLREGLDLPEVSLVAILDADKEGFLRSDTSLIQTMGRAARHKDGHVIMYADIMTDSMKRAIAEVNRRRKLQITYNKKHKIIPKTIIKAVSDTRLAGKKLLTEQPSEVNLKNLSKQEIAHLLEELKDQMDLAAKNLEFEKATKLRDEIIDIRKKLSQKRH
jgi:excinuclease ABC subunit B